MRYLLDSNVLFWLRYDSRKIAREIQGILADADNDVFYSVITPWEFSIKQTKGKLQVTDDFFTNMPKLGFACLMVEEEHVSALRTLPLLHHDPFDRMLVAQAKTEEMTFVTADKKLADYPIKTLMVTL